MSEPYRKKLIEVALPLEAINRESAREKSIRHGHPSTLHLWWARRPLAACRAVLFASIVDDPSSRPDLFPTDQSQEDERHRLFGIIERLVKWENSNNAAVLAEARTEVMKATEGRPPPVLDPFCGGGSIPLEAQRLGLEASSDTAQRGRGRRGSPRTSATTGSGCATLQSSALGICTQRRSCRMDAVRQ